MLGNFSWVLSSADPFQHSFFFSKYSFKNNIRLSNSLDPDQAQRSVRTDLGPNGVQRSSADVKIPLAKISQSATLHVNREHLIRTTTLQKYKNEPRHAISNNVAFRHV